MDRVGMAARRAFVSLALCLLLGKQTSARNDAPCQPSKWNNGYSRFLKRHLPSGTPDSVDHNEWEKFIKSLGGCDRPTQSFLHPKDLDRVRAVCSDEGGKVFKDNLCISQQPFTFVTVRSTPGTCGIRKVERERKHLILACEVLENVCVPVHFEGNPTDQRPSNNARGCQSSQRRNQAATFQPSWLWLIFTFLVTFYAF
uniref:Si:dkey-237j11.3 n=1 Tax=Oryzias latipes TaxID=8090 RepID=A0A3B3H9Y5_ORYLA